MSDWPMAQQSDWLKEKWSQFENRPDLDHWHFFVPKVDYPELDGLAPRAIKIDFKPI